MFLQFSKTRVAVRSIEFQDSSCQKMLLPDRVDPIDNVRPVNDGDTVRLNLAFFRHRLPRTIRFFALYVFKTYYFLTNGIF